MIIMIIPKNFVKMLMGKSERSPNFIHTIHVLWVYFIGVGVGVGGGTPFPFFVGGPFHCIFNAQFTPRPPPPPKKKTENPSSPYPRALY
jgi:hypothetical protein